MVLGCLITLLVIEVTTFIIIDKLSEITDKLSEIARILRDIRDGEEKVY